MALSQDNCEIVLRYFVNGVLAIYDLAVTFDREVGIVLSPHSHCTRCTYRPTWVAEIPPGGVSEISGGNWHLILAESEQFEYIAKVIPVIVQPKEIFARKHT